MPIFEDSTILFSILAILTALVLFGAWTWFQYNRESFSDVFPEGADDPRLIQSIIGFILPKEHEMAKMPIEEAVKLVSETKVMNYYIDNGKVTRISTVRKQKMGIAIHDIRVIQPKLNTLIRMLDRFDPIEVEYMQFLGIRFKPHFLYELKSQKRYDLLSDALVRVTIRGIEDGESDSSNTTNRSYTG